MFVESVWNVIRGGFHINYNCKACNVRDLMKSFTNVMMITNYYRCSDFKMYLEKLDGDLEICVNMYIFLFFKLI